MRMLRSSQQAGFTLIEMVIVTVLISVLAAFAGLLIVTPVQSFSDVARRAELVDIADNALQRMTRELRHALPNSVRIGSVGSRDAMEFLNTTTGGRFRARLDSGGGGDPLINNSADTFDVLGGVISGVNAGSAGQANCLTGAADCLVLYNTGTGSGNFNAYAGDNIASITAVDTGANRLSYDNSGSWSFPFPIPPASQQRFYVIDQAVSYVCDSSTNQLRRYADYGISATQPVTNGQFGSSGALLANNISDCQFSYSSGAGTRHGLVTVRIELTDNGERIALLYQIHVTNSP